MPIQTTTTTQPPQLNSSRFLTFKFEDKLLHWLIGVKCQNLRYLNLSLYFNLLMPFNVMLSIIYLSLLPRHSLSSFTATVISLHSFSQLTTHHFRSNLSTKSKQFCSVLCNVLRHFVYSIPLLSAHPSFYFASQLFPQLHFANVVVKLLFPSTFFSLCRSNHTNQIAASITQNVIHLLHSYNIRHFIQNCHSAPHFDSTSARHLLHHFY